MKKVELSRMILLITKFYILLASMLNNMTTWIALDEEATDTNLL